MEANIKYAFVLFILCITASCDDGSDCYTEEQNITEVFHFGSYPPCGYQILLDKFSNEYRFKKGGYLDYVGHDNIDSAIDAAWGHKAMPKFFKIDFIEVDFKQTCKGVGY